MFIRVLVVFAALGLMMIAIGLPAVVGRPWSTDWALAVARVLIFLSGFLFGLAFAFRVEP